MLRKDTAKLILDMGPLMDLKFFRSVMQQLKTGLSPMQMRLLFVLRQRGRTNLTALSDEMHIPKQQMTPLMDKLCAKNFVLRISDTTDRRIVNVEITADGLDFINRHDENMLELFAVRLQQLNDDDVAILNEAFQNIHNVFGKIS